MLWYDMIRFSSLQSPCCCGILKAAPLLALKAFSLKGSQHPAM